MTVWLLHTALDYVVVYPERPTVDTAGFWPRQWIHDFSPRDVRALEFAAELERGVPRACRVVAGAWSRWQFKRRTPDLVIFTKDGSYMQSFCRWILEDVGIPDLPVGESAGVVFDEALACD